jgi:hypothetical protein
MPNAEFDRAVDDKLHQQQSNCDWNGSNLSDGFAQLVAAGVVEINDAYERAGYVRRCGNPYRLARKPGVAARIQELRSEIDPGDVRTAEHVHAKLLEIAAELLRTAGNRDAAARIANDLRRLVWVIEHLAGVSIWATEPQ